MMYSLNPFSPLNSPIFHSPSPIIQTTRPFNILTPTPTPLHQNNLQQRRLNHNHEHNSPRSTHSSPLSVSSPAYSSPSSSSSSSSSSPSPLSNSTPLSLSPHVHDMNEKHEKREKHDRDIIDLSVSTKGLQLRPRHKEEEEEAAAAEEEETIVNTSKSGFVRSQLKRHKNELFLRPMPFFRAFQDHPQYTFRIEAPTTKNPRYRVYYTGEMEIPADTLLFQLTGKIRSYKTIGGKPLLGPQFYVFSDTWESSHDENAQKLTYALDLSVQYPKDSHGKWDADWIQLSEIPICIRRADEAEIRQGVVPNCHISEYYDFPGYKKEYMRKKGYEPNEYVPTDELPTDIFKDAVKRNPCGVSVFVKSSWTIYPHDELVLYDPEDTPTLAYRIKKKGKVQGKVYWREDAKDQIGPKDDPENMYDEDSSEINPNDVGTETRTPYSCFRRSLLNYIDMSTSIRQEMKRYMMKSILETLVKLRMKPLVSNIKKGIIPVNIPGLAIILQDFTKALQRWLDDDTTFEGIKWHLRNCIEEMKIMQSDQSPSEENETETEPEKKTTDQIKVIDQTMEKYKSKISSKIDWVLKWSFGIPKEETSNNGGDDDNKSTENDEESNNSIAVNEASNAELTMTEAQKIAHKERLETRRKLKEETSRLVKGLIDPKSCKNLYVDLEAKENRLAGRGTDYRTRTKDRNDTGTLHVAGGMSVGNNPQPATAFSPITNNNRTIDEINRCPSYNAVGDICPHFIACPQCTRINCSNLTSLCSACNGVLANDDEEEGDNDNQNDMDQDEMRDVGNGDDDDDAYDNDDDDDDEDGEENDSDDKDPDYEDPEEYRRDWEDANEMGAKAEQKREIKTIVNDILRIQDDTLQEEELRSYDIFPEEWRAISRSQRRNTLTKKLLQWFDKRDRQHEEELKKHKNSKKKPQPSSSAANFAFDNNPDTYNLDRIVTHYTEEYFNDDVPDKRKRELKKRFGIPREEKLPMEQRMIVIQNFIRSYFTDKPEELKNELRKLDEDGDDDDDDGDESEVLEVKRRR